MVMTSAEEPQFVAGSILERAEKDAETLDRLSIPADQRIIDDKTLEWVADVPGLQLMMSSSARKKRTWSLSQSVQNWKTVLQLLM